MTLCCVWYSVDGWQMASDSRLTVTEGLTVDISVKVTSFRVRIPFPSSAGMEGNRWLIDQDVGFMAAGDVGTTYPTREAFRAAMSWLWVNPSFGPELSMAKIADISAEILLRLWRKRSEMDVDPVVATVCILGWCPVMKVGRAFLLIPEVQGDQTRVTVREVGASEGPQYFGSAAQTARTVSTDIPLLTPCQVIRRVITERCDPHVGGRVQYGRLAAPDFRLYAVYDFDVDEENKSLSTGYFIGGIEFLAEEDKLRLPEGYTLLPNHAVTPFLEEQEEYIKRGYTPVTSYSHFATLVGKPGTGL